MLIRRVDGLNRLLESEVADELFGFDVGENVFSGLKVELGRVSEFVHFRKVFESEGFFPKSRSFILSDFS